MPRRKKLSSTTVCKTWSTRWPKTRLTIRIKRRYEEWKRKPTAWTPSAPNSDWKTNEPSRIKWNENNCSIHRWETTKYTRSHRWRRTKSSIKTWGLCTQRTCRQRSSVLTPREGARSKLISILWRQGWELTGSRMIKGPTPGLKCSAEMLSMRWKSLWLQRLFQETGILRKTNWRRSTSTRRKPSKTGSICSSTYSKKSQRISLLTCLKQSFKSKWIRSVTQY